MMQKQEIRFAVTEKDGVITNIGKAHIFQPPISFTGGSVKWYDDSKLVKRDGKATGKEGGGRQ